MDQLFTMLNYIPSIIQYVLAFSLLITVVVFVHEMGHYLVGKWCGIGVETFSIGMGKQIWGRYDKSGTLWRVALFPVGGYVKFKGDEDLSGKKDLSSKVDDSENFHSKSVWQKIATTAAGPIFNFILAIFIFWGLPLASRGSGFTKLWPAGQAGYATFPILNLVV